MHLFFIPKVSFQSFLRRVQRALLGFLLTATLVLPKPITDEVRPPLKRGHVVAPVGRHSEQPVLGNALEGTGNNLENPTFTIESGEGHATGDEEFDILTIKRGDILGL